MTESLHDLSSLQSKYGYNHHTSAINRCDYTKQLVELEHKIAGWRDDNTQFPVDDGNRRLNDIMERVYLKSNLMFEYLDSTAGYSELYVYSLYLLNEIHNDISLFKYSLILRNCGLTPKNTEEVSVIGAGICGDFSALFIKLAGKFNIPSRRIEFYYEDINHVAVEVKYNDRWRFIDVMWKAFFKNYNVDPDDLLSIDSIISGGEHVIVHSDSTSLNHQMYARSEDPFFYLNTVCKVVKGSVGDEDKIQCL